MGRVMQIITRRSDPAHRLAFGGRDAAERFAAAATNPADWALDDPPDQIIPASPTGDDAQRDPAGAQ